MFRHRFKKKFIIPILDIRLYGHKFLSEYRMDVYFEYVATTFKIGNLSSPFEQRKKNLIEQSVFIQHVHFSQS